MSRSGAWPGRKYVRWQGGLPRTAYTAGTEGCTSSRGARQVDEVTEVVAVEVEVIKPIGRRQ